MSGDPKDSGLMVSQEGLRQSIWNGSHIAFTFYPAFLTSIKRTLKEGLRFDFFFSPGSQGVSKTIWDVPPKTSVLFSVSLAPHDVLTVDPEQLDYATR